MSHANMLKIRRKKQAAKKLLRRTEKRAQREYFEGKAAPATP